MVGPSEARLAAKLQAAVSGDALEFEISGPERELEPFQVARIDFAYRAGRPIPLGGRLALIGELSFSGWGPNGTSMRLRVNWLSQREAAHLGWSGRP